jgi:hypothetical protein
VLALHAEMDLKMSVATNVAPSFRMTCAMELFGSIKSYSLQPTKSGIISMARLLPTQHPYGSLTKPPQGHCGDSEAGAIHVCTSRTFNAADSSSACISFSRWTLLTPMIYCTADVAPGIVPPGVGFAIVIFRHAMVASVAMHPVWFHAGITAGAMDPRAPVS